MAQIVNVQLLGDAALVSRIKTAPARVHAALFRKITILAFLLEMKIKSEKLSGQVLHVRTGALRRSIHSVVEDEGTLITGKAASSGDVKYAARHEFGFDGEEVVQAHMRTIKQAFGHAISPKEVLVKQFRRHAHTDERSFMRSSLGEMKDKILASMEAAVQEGLDGR